MTRSTVHQTFVAALAGTVALASSAGAQSTTNPPVHHYLLMDRLGKAVPTPTNAVHSSLHPAAAAGLGGQIPTPVRGAALPDEVQQRIADKSAQRGAWEWFPATPPVMPPYLGGLDEFGNTALAPVAIFPKDPVSAVIQRGKTTLSDVGFRYAAYQSFTLTTMSDVAKGDSTLDYYTAALAAKWAVFDAPPSGLAGWLSTEVDVQLGLTPASRRQTPRENLATIVNPLETVFGPEGLWIAELAWQQSLLNGELVVLAGMVDQSNYVDENAYANNSQGQLMNSALVNSLVLPLPYNNFGMNIQWQPSDSWYLMFGSGANNQAAGTVPWNHLSFDNWSYLLEVGFTPKDVFGLGPGAYRIQPFLATVAGETQAGLCFNLAQQLGPSSPFAWFGRFGVGGADVTIAGAKAQIGTGFVMQAPLKYAGLFPSLSNDYLGAGFVWSQPSAAFGPAAHDNEYGLETTYVLQLTPTASLQPDFQVIWNPAGNAHASSALIFQLQVNLTW